MAQDDRIELLFKKYDALLEKFGDHDKWAAAQSSKFDESIKTLNEKILQLQQEQRSQGKDIVMNAESGVDDRHKLEILVKDMISTAKVEAIQEGRDYTNKGVATVVAVFTVISLILGIIYHIYVLTHPVH